MNGRIFTHRRTLRTLDVFFDFFLKGMDNGWENTPKIRLSILDPSGNDLVNREEEDWPVKVSYTKLYLDAKRSSLSLEPPSERASLSYLPLDERGKAVFTYVFPTDAEVIGYIKLKLFVEVRDADDADLFALLEKCDPYGNPLHPPAGPFVYYGPHGRLRLSHRTLDERLSSEWFPVHSHREEKKIKEGDIVSCEIPLWPTGMRWRKGEILKLTICGFNPIPFHLSQVPPLKTLNKGLHVIHTGGEFQSFILFTNKIPLGGVTMKKLFGIFLAILVFVVSGNINALEKKGEVYQLVFSSSNPPVAPIVKAALGWFEVLKSETNGRVDFKIITGGGLLKEEEVFRGVQSGVADIATYILDERDGFVLNGVIMLPFIPWPSREMANEIYEKLLQQFPEMEREWQGVKHFAFSMMPPNHIHMRKKLVRTLEDIKGMKIAITGKYAPIVKALGAVPVEVPIQDWYPALERGVVDGCLNHFAVLRVFKLLDLLPNHTIFGPGGINMGALGIIMNANTWESLPKDIQEAFL